MRFFSAEGCGKGNFGRAGPRAARLGQPCLMGLLTRRNDLAGNDRGAKKPITLNSGTPRGIARSVVSARSDRLRSRSCQTTSFSSPKSAFANGLLRQEQVAGKPATKS